MKRPKIDDKGFSVPLALTDMIPVLFFGLSAIRAALFVGRADLNGRAILAGLLSFPACIIFGLGVLGMVLMVIFAIKLDCGNPKANWLEQAVNGAAQACFFIGLLLV